MRSTGHLPSRVRPSRKTPRALRVVVMAVGADAHLCLLAPPPRSVCRRVVSCLGMHTNRWYLYLLPTVGLHERLSRRRQPVLLIKHQRALDARVFTRRFSRDLS